ncbi:MAG TPA: response regulator, partial [Candidatus Marinimicrobia bacterium]|nr:response regulator [Candidatus Neomarinimicrobiota bacterium]
RNIGQETRFIYRNAESILVLVFGILFTLIILHILISVENRQKRENFQQIGKYLSVFLLDEFHNICDYDLEGLARFAESQNTITENSFHQYAQSLKEKQAAISWGILTLPPAKSKPDYQAAQILFQTSTEFSLSELDQKQIHSAMDEAFKYRLNSSTDHLTLSGGKKINVIFRPIFSQENDSLITAFAFSVIDFGKLLSKVNLNINQHDDRLCLDLYQMNEDGEAFLLASLQDFCDASRDPRNTLFQPIFVAGKTFLATVHPNPYLLFARRFGSSWFVALAGLLMTLALSLTIRVITNRKSFLEKEVHNRTGELQESVIRYSALFENLHTVMMIIDPKDGQIVDANPAAAKYYGWPREDLKAKLISEINTLSPEKIQQEMHQALSSQKNYFKFQHRLANGNIRDVEVYSSAVDIQDHKLLYTIVHDVTDRNAYENNLKTSESRLRKQRVAIATLALDESMLSDEKLEPSLDLITRIVASAIDVQRVSIWLLNDDADEMLCISLWDANKRIHSKGDILLPAQYPAYFNAIINESLINAPDAANDPRTYEMKIPYLQPLGIVSMLDAAILKNGKLAGVVCLEHCGKIRHWHSDEEAFVSAIAAMTGQYFANIDRKKAETAQEKLQNQLIQAQKMESIGKLAGGVAHDFNNMLSVITGFADIALQESELSASLRSYILEIRRAALRSAELTRQLLTFARKQSIDLKILHINRVIEDMLKMLRRLIGENIKLIWKPGDFIWTVKMDPVQLDQILANLCVNARDAIEDTGEIIIETSTKIIDQDYCQSHLDISPGEYLVLTVSDNGAGMDKEIQKHVFEPFFTTKMKGEGTGLGLATIYGIVRQNHGAINVYSEPGKGTSFRIYLPRHTGDLLPAERKPQAPPPLNISENNMITILLVEDESSILLMAETILRRSAYKVLTAESAKKAMNILENYDHEIHLLISDLVLPDTNGRELAKSVKEKYPLIRTIFMSGYTENVIAHHGILEKGVHFLEKPFTMDGLLKKVKEVLNHRVSKEN